MLYRKINKTAFEPSILGLGCMRLPVVDDNYGQIDEEKAIEMIRYAIDHGINYIDTAYPYHEENSERLVGKALKDGYREKAILVTKSPVWKVESYEDFEKYLDEQLEKLQTDVIDIYLLHALNRSRWEVIEPLGCLNFLDQMIKKGKIKAAAFSIHDDYEFFKEVIDSYDWSLAMIQMNYMDVDSQTTVKAIDYAQKKNVSIAIMEPLKGGQLANLPSSINQLWNKDPMKQDPVERALKWAANFENVKVILSGMSSLDQIKENIKIGDSMLANALSQEEEAKYKQVKETLESRIQVACTDCKYCMPCPAGVNIPVNFKLYNESFMYEDLEGRKKTYQEKLKEEQRADACIACGACEPQCPQKIEIIEALKKVSAYFK
jgi:predicted aldo/keto reductase-like oxidoreductase